MCCQAHGMDIKCDNIDISHNDNNSYLCTCSLHLSESFQWKNVLNIWFKGLSLQKIILVLNTCVL